MILITGGMGFIGLHTARRFLDGGEQVVLTQFHARREPDFIRDDLASGRAIVETLDVTDTDRMLEIARKHGVDSIVHLAVPGLAALSPADDFRTNMLGLLNVLETGRQIQARRVSIASSNAVYSALKSGPFCEEDALPLPASNPTEAFKKAEEVLGQHYADRTGMDIIFMRLGGIYGPLYHSMANLPSRLTHAAIHGTQPELSGRGGTPYADDGGDMCYVKDCAAGIVAVHCAPQLNHRVYNVGSGRMTTNGELAEAVNQAVPGAGVSVPAGKSPRHREKAYMDLTRTTADTGYTPKFTIQTAIADYADWLRHNPQ